jgi:hypothetical protein
MGYFDKSLPNIRKQNGRSFKQTARRNQTRLALRSVIHFPRVGKWHEKLQKNSPGPPHNADECPPRARYARRIAPVLQRGEPPSRRLAAKGKEDAPQTPPTASSSAMEPGTGMKVSSQTQNQPVARPIHPIASTSPDRPVRRPPTGETVIIPSQSHPRSRIPRNQANRAAVFVLTCSCPRRSDPR